MAPTSAPTWHQGYSLGIEGTNVCPARSENASNDQYQTQAITNCRSAASTLHTVAQPAV